MPVSDALARPTGHGASVPPRDRPCTAQTGFTLLEVLVALTIVALAVVTLIQLSSQSLRLVKTSGDYQLAAQLADRMARETHPTDEGVESGQEGLFQWERRTSLVALPEELQPKETVPGKEPTKLFAVTIAVRWGQNQTLELATLYTPTTAPSIPQPGSGGGLQQSPRTSPTVQATPPPASR